MNHLLYLKDLSTEEVLTLVDRAEAFANGERKTLNKIVANLFFEPSTRTEHSFEAAEHHLGCKLLTFNKDTSSVLKGESFYDTVMTFAQYVDALVIRHSVNEYHLELLPKIGVPIINAGDGILGHPTQGLLDLLTIKQAFGRYEGLTVAIVGDIAHSRVARTNIEIMERLGMKIFCDAPDSLKNGRGQYDYQPIDEVIDQVDIFMPLRIQYERHLNGTKLTEKDYHEQFGLTEMRYNRLKEGAIIMHPGPVNRNVEIASSLVESEKSRIFTQMKNGVYARMAAIEWALGGESNETY